MYFCFPYSVNIDYLKNLSYESILVTDFDYSVLLEKQFAIMLSFFFLKDRNGNRSSDKILLKCLQLKCHISRWSVSSE